MRNRTCDVWGCVMWTKQRFRSPLFPATTRDDTIYFDPPPHQCYKCGIIILNYECYDAIHFMFDISLGILPVSRGQTYCLENSGHRQGRSLNTPGHHTLLCCVHATENVHGVCRKQFNCFLYILKKYTSSNPP